MVPGNEQKAVLGIQFIQHNEPMFHAWRVRARSIIGHIPQVFYYIRHYDPE